ncbi:Uncharacterised protein [Ewingella americana]|uniref:Uncharacterized protein n=1 Tax=Ewingella americana TaxID=41202 RepID=A0A377N8R3_9GAMM|nr:Uncharacterised protein [Ewingella americana]
MEKLTAQGLEAEWLPVLKAWIEAILNTPAR